MEGDVYQVDYDGGRHAELLFEDRTDAGRQLVRRLAQQVTRNPVVLGVARGGVVVALEVARALHAPLDVIVVRKVGAPFNRELALGAVCADGSSYLRYDAAHEFSIGREQLEEEVERRAVEARAAEIDYREDAPAVDVTGREVIIVDDGVATGATIEAAIQCARRRGATRVTVAVPVASIDAAERLSAAADEFIALETPYAFLAVGQCYRDFSHVTDKTVRWLLGQSRTASKGKEGAR